MKLPTVHARAMAWIADHQDDDDFDEPLPPPPTTAQLLDRLVRPATRPRKDKSYADQFMQAPALRPATHYVVHSLHARFWVRSHSFELFLFRGSVFLTMLGNRTQCMRCCCTSWAWSVPSSCGSSEPTRSDLIQFLFDFNSI